MTVCLIVWMKLWMTDLISESSLAGAGLLKDCNAGNVAACTMINGLKLLMERNKNTTAHIDHMHFYHHHRRHL